MPCDTGWLRRPAGCGCRDIREVLHRQKPSASFTGCALAATKVYVSPAALWKSSQSLRVALALQRASQ